MNKIFLSSTRERMATDERLAFIRATSEASRLSHQELARSTPATPITRARLRLEREVIL